jgi:hypothetical protein
MIQLDFPTSESLGTLVLMRSECAVHLFPMLSWQSERQSGMWTEAYGGVACPARGAVRHADNLESALVLSWEGLRLLSTTPVKLPAALGGLFVSGMPFTNQHLDCLVGCARLGWLVLRQSAVSDTGLERIGALRSLKWLDLSERCEFRFPGEDGANADEVERWRQTLPEITGSGLHHLAHPPLLEHLDLSRRWIDSRYIGALSTMQALKSLSLGAIVKSVAGSCAAPVPLPGLVEFCSNGGPLALGMILPGLRDIEVLRLPEVDLDDSVFRSFEGLTCLRELDLSWACLDDSTATPLVLPSGLEDLDLSDTEARGLRILGTARHRLTCLKRLNLHATKTTDEDVAPLRTLTSLEHLDLSKTPVTDAALLYLTQLGSLRSVNLTETEVTEDGVQAFRRARDEVEVGRTRDWYPGLRESP